MRVWDLPPGILCRAHLLGEHREIHCIYKVIRTGSRGYSRHPETLRWVGRLPALRQRHDAVVAEMKRRGYNHQSPLPVEPGLIKPLTGEVNTIEEQAELLREKNCSCFSEATCE